MEKNCNSCHINKNFEEFYLAKGWRMNMCKMCYRLHRKQWDNKRKEKIKEYNKQYRLQHNNLLKNKKSEFYFTNKQIIQKQKHIYNLQHKEQISLRKKEYSIKNKDKINNYFNNRKKYDINFKLTTSLRSRTSSALKNNAKTGSAVQDLGCSIDELKLHIQSKFSEGMSWDNYGQWHIDHIKPLISFDLSDRQQFLQACNYTNLQPLWASDNLRKGCKLIEN